MLKRIQILFHKEREEYPLLNFSCMTVVLICAVTFSCLMEEATVQTPF